MFQHLVYLGIFSGISVKLSRTQDIPCTVSQDGGGTLYRIPEFTATECLYQWTNTTNHVIANQAKHCTAQVVRKSSRTLLTYKCLKLVHYIRNCISEGGTRVAICITNCSGNVRLLKEGEISRNHWIAVTAAITVVLLLLGLLIYNCRNHICRCRKVRRLYSSVKTQNNKADVEEQRL